MAASADSVVVPSSSDAPQPTPSNLTLDAKSTAEQNRKSKASKDKSLDSLVAKAIADNLKGWSAVELDGTRDKDGRTCREVLTDRKRLNLTDARKYPLGKKFYSDLKAKFRAADSPQKLLQPPVAEQPINPKLLAAMVAYKRNGNKGLMLNYLQSAEDINGTEVCGLLQFALELKASTSWDHLRSAKAVLQFMVDRRFKVHFKEQLAHSLKWIDETMCFLYLKAKQAKVKPSEFLHLNRGIALLVLPEKDIDVLLAHTGNWQSWAIRAGAIERLGFLGTTPGSDIVAQHPGDHRKLVVMFSRGELRGPLSRLGEWAKG